MYYALKELSLKANVRELNLLWTREKKNDFDPET